MPSSEPDPGGVLPGGSERARGLRKDRRDDLRAALDPCLTSRFPILIWREPGLSVLYNDACIPILGTATHPGMSSSRRCFIDQRLRAAPLAQERPAHPLGLHHLVSRRPGEESPIEGLGAGADD